MSFAVVLTAGNPWYESTRIPDTVDRKLRKFADYANGWAFGRGLSFPRHVLANARLLLDQAAMNSSFDALDVFPGRYGNLVVSLYKESDEYNFDVKPATITLSKEIQGVDSDDVQLSLVEALSAIKEIEADICGSYFSYKKTTTITTKDDLKAQRSSLGLMALGFQSSTQNAHLENLNVLVSMPTSCTVHPSLPTRLDSITGNSNSTFFRNIGESWRHLATPAMIATEKLRA